MRKKSSTNFSNEVAITENCPIAATFKMVGGRWKLMILWNLREKPLRYKELHRSIPRISEKMLTQQLSVLIEDGWVTKKDFQSIPPHTEYHLSALGKSFLPVLQKVYDWGKSKNIVAYVNSRTQLE